jgi:16S rRNA processing protein RimM
MAASQQKKVCLGVVVGAHGVRGLVKVKAYTEEPDAVAAYGPVETKDGRRFEIEALGLGKGTVLCRLEGVDDRDEAERLRGTELFVDRARLPEPDEAEGWYHADLIGLSAVGRDGRAYGAIVGVENFGAGDLLEIRPPEGGATVYLPFTDDNVPSVEIEAGRVVIDPPGGLFDGGADEAEHG